MPGKGTRYWVQRLSQSEMPVLAASVKQLSDLTDRPDTQVAELAEVILKDANLTTQVLRVANSVHYNPHALKINTVSRAIIILGFDRIRSLCVSLIVVEKLLRASVRRRLSEAMAKSVHCAIQARELMSNDDTQRREEAFIAGLLLNLGELVFWAQDPPEANELEYRLGKGDIPKISCQLLLGTSFTALSKGLCEAWHLGPLLAGALSNHADQTARLVTLTGMLADTVTTGWDDPLCSSIVQEIAKLIGKSPADTEKLLHVNAREARKFAKSIGGGFAHLIIDPGANDVVATEQHKHLDPLPFDANLQLSILRELTASVGEMDANFLFQMVLEGLHRGVGLERVIVCLVSGEQLYARYLLGDCRENWRNHLKFQIGARSNLFTAALNEKKAQWIRDPIAAWSKYSKSRTITNTVGYKPAFIAPIHFNQKPVAVVYADRHIHSQLLSEEQFEAFKHFVSHTELCLTLIRKAGITS